MPQINQLPDIFFSQLFWLLWCSASSTSGSGAEWCRRSSRSWKTETSKIADDLAAAQRAREQAEAAEEAYRERIDASRSEALKVAQEAKHQAALDTEKRLKTIDAKIGKSVAEAEEKIRAAADAARRELEPVAAEAASELVTKLTGQKIAAKDAEPAVKAVLHG